MVEREKPLLFDWDREIVMLRKLDQTTLTSGLAAGLASGLVPTSVGELFI